jgi:hypothetical protein
VISAETRIDADLWFPTFVRQQAPQYFCADPLFFEFWLPDGLDLPHIPAIRYRTGTQAFCA